jgi:hypothetical protein
VSTGSRQSNVGWPLTMPNSRGSFTTPRRSFCAPTRPLVPPERGHHDARSTLRGGRRRVLADSSPAEEAAAHPSGRTVTRADEWQSLVTLDR